jgi:hypothetical protein
MHLQDWLWAATVMFLDPNKRRGDFNTKEILKLFWRWQQDFPLGKRRYTGFLRAFFVLHRRAYLHATDNRKPWEALCAFTLSMQLPSKFRSQGHTVDGRRPDFIPSSCASS